MDTSGILKSLSVSPADERGRPNSLNLRGKAMESLLEMLDACERPSSRREYSRWQFRRESIEMRLVQSGGSTNIKVLTRNISRGGLSLLHNNFMHPLTRCEVSLPHPVRGKVLVPGRVIRCVHRGGVVHEVGVRFDQPVDARYIADVDPLDNQFSYAEPPTDQLSGTCVLVSHSPEDGSMVRQALGDTTLSFASFDSVAVAAPILFGADLVLLATDLPESTPKQSVGALRDTGFGGGIVLLAPDREPRTRLAVLAAPADVILVKPFEGRELLLALAECQLIAKPAARKAAS
ncbi:MAG: PilZ domain-containing protein [Phycisphaerales bacterium]|jgi:hypothetical protein